MSYYEIRPINRSCGSYGPGHLMHWIQGKKSHEEGQPIIKVKVVAVHDDGRVEIQGDDLKLTLWYHHPDHLRSALCFGGRAEWKPKYHVLYVISSGSFNLATLDTVEPVQRPFLESIPRLWLSNGDAFPPGRRPSRLRVGVFADRPAPPALACGIGTSRLTNSHIGSFSGRLEDHATPNLDGMVGEAFIKPAQERNIDGGCDAMGPVLLPEKSE